MRLPPLTVAGWLTHWTLDLPVVLLVLIVSAAYLLARARVRDWPAGRTATFLLGMAGVVVVKTCFLAVYDHTLFWTLAVQDVLLVALVPIPLVLGRPVQLARLAVDRPGRGRRTPSPVWGSLVAMSTLLAVYITSWDQARLEHPALFTLTHLVLLGSGCAFLGPLLAERGTAYGVRTLVAFVDGLLDAIPGLAVLGTHSVIAGSWYAAHPRHWGPTPLDDQRLGATAMIALSELVGLPALIVLLVQWVRADAVEAAATDAQLDVVTAAEHAAAGEAVLQRPWWETDAGPLAQRAADQKWHSD
jgi:cytochrome c oxidase assembly factor CtaG